MNDSADSANNDRTIALQEPMDPTVAALLSDDDDANNANVAALRTRMGLIRLQQARIHGGATYAATILEQALAASQQSRHVHERLGARLIELEARVAVVVAEEEEEAQQDNNASASSGHSTTRAASNATADSNNEEEGGDGPNENNNEDDTDKQQFSAAERSELTHHIATLEEILSERILAELDAIQTDRKRLQEQTLRLQERVTSVQKTVDLLKEANNNNNNHPSSSSTALYDTIAPALAASTSTPAIITSSSCCVACQSQPAVRAILPCGHVCLCDACTVVLLQLPTNNDNNTTTTSSSSTGDNTKKNGGLQQCPLCRGPLLSTLKICTAQ